jgi:hypothetical protein
MNLKNVTTVCALAFSATVLGGVAFAESAADARKTDADAKEAQSPPDGIQTLREPIGVIMSRLTAEGSDPERAQKDLVRVVAAVDSEQAGAAKPTDTPKPADGPQKPDDPKKVPEAKADTKKPEDATAKILKGFFGTLDVSVDDTTKGIAGKVATQYGLANFPPDRTTLVTSVHAPPVGRVDYMLALSTNKSGFGYRGERPIGQSNTKFIYQISAGVAITSSPGSNTSYTQQANLTKSGIGFGDTFIGIKGDWGALKFGTTYAPYKTSTDRLNPFSGLLGDFAAVMGNSGGDNRVEAGTRLDHSIWYESPKFGGGFLFAVLFSPGQNRTYDNVVQSSGSPDCNGGNLPGSGNLPLNCDDGGFDDAFSGSLRYENGGFYASVGGEWHHNVNRNSDGIGSNNYLYALFAADHPDLVISATNNPQGLPASALGSYTNDIGNEWFANVAVQYRFPFKFTLGGIYEWMRRDIPAYLAFQNERSRDGWWLTATQEIGPKGSVSVGWAHAAKTPGDPGGEHNYNPFAKADTANMYTVAYKHKLDKQLTWYIDYANTVNHGNVHYDIGAGGRGLTTDCHDGTNTVFVDYSGTGPTTWGGCHIQGFSTGLNFKF